MRGRAKRLCLALMAFALLAAPAAAQAELTFQTSFGSGGAKAGKFANPASIAINSASGDLYVVDRANNRIQQLSSAGAFIRAWGYDVVESGADNKPFANEVSEVRIRASGGSFKLAFKEAETTPLPFNASAGEVQAALNALSTISAGGGSVTVSGGPGDLSGSNPYLVSFNGGPLAATNLELGIEPSGLGVPTGTQLSCEGGPSVQESFGPPPAEAFAYQWLANGAAIAGATSTTFTPGPAEAGKAIQCQVTATFGAIRTMAASRPYSLASPAPTPLPPLGPKTLAAPEGLTILESAGGVPLTCNAGTWSGAPESFTYRWYRNGKAIGTPTTTAATSSEYILTKADLATKAVFQCAVTANNAGGSATTISEYISTDPGQKEPVVQKATAAATLAPVGASKVITRTNGGAVFELCKANPPSNDVCKAGLAGSGVGQLSAPRSVAVDNSPGGGGAVYVMDDDNPRVQKFSAEGTPLALFGKAVNQTTDGNLCTLASADVCGAGLRDRDGAAGAFGGPPSVTGNFAELGNELAVDAAGNIYVGDPRASSDFTQPRIQKFDPAGAFLAQAKIPYIFGNVNAPVKPTSVTVDSTQLAYAALPNEFAAVEKIGPAEFNAAGDAVQRGGNMVSQEPGPAQLALDPRNDRLLASYRNASEEVSTCGGPPLSGRAIVEFDVHQNLIDCSIPTGPGALPQVTGMAVSKAGLLYTAIGSQNLIKVFKLPLSTAPQVSAPSAQEITTETAVLHAQVNPGFEDTTYSVEYGLANCVSEPCQSAEGGVLHGLKALDAATPIAGLQPNTTYHYRVIAENKLGTVKGPDRTFTTFALVDLVNDPCPNALARKQTKTVGLLDCRAYELASAPFSGGYDVESNVVAGQSPFDAYPDAAGKLLYGVHEGGIPNTGNPTNRGLDPYLATRGKDGWATKYVGIPADNPFASAPFSSTVAGADAGLDTLAFGGPEICSPCFADGSTGIPVHLPNGDLVQGMAGSIPQLAAKAAGHIGKSLSADGAHLIFGSTSQFEQAGNDDGKVTIYERDLKAGTTEVVSTLPDGSTMDGAIGEAGQLDLSADGSRVLIGEAISTDAKGNTYWHPYLHLSGQPNSVDLAPTTTSGVLFNGMTQDGTEVFFTSKDKLLAAEDEDESADIYAAQVDSGGALDLSLVSVKADGSPSNSNACAPAGEPASWNTAAGNGKCSALAFAGGAGLAAGDASFYFTSPEKLDPSQGALNQPNLYLSRPGANPRFIATIDTSVGKPPASPPVHPLLDANFGDTEFAVVQALTVDQSNGDLYALDPFEGTVSRFDSSGAPHDFSAGPDAGTNTLSGLSLGFSLSTAQVALDNSASALSGDLYLTSEAGVSLYAPSGEKLGTLTGSATNKGAFGSACGVAVDQSSGALYVGDSAGFIWRYAPAAPTVPITDADYTVKGITTSGMKPCALAADSGGRVYGAEAPAGPVARFAAASFATGAPPSAAGIEIDPAARALATDPTTNELYVDEGNQIAVFDSTGKALSTIGQGKLACGAIGSRGVAVNKTSHHVYASCFAPSVVKEFGYEVPPFTPVDNPAILHATNQAQTHSYGDFQVSPEGRYAAFATTQPLKAGYDNAAHYELYRYDADAGEGAGQLDCVSCSPTESQAGSDSVLAPNGLGLLSDGRLFFNTAEQLTLRDTNQKLDAYEWKQGTQQLLSTGASAFPSGLLGVSADGTDALFFTREVLVGEDQNGQAMKIYDARAGGGFFVVPPPPPCAASDECHGPGTQASAPPPIGTFKGTGGQHQQAPACKKPKVKRHGKCVRPHKPRKHKGKAAKARGARR